MNLCELEAGLVYITNSGSVKGTQWDLSKTKQNMKKKSCNVSQAWWFTPEIPTLEMLKQEDHPDFKMSLADIMSSSAT